MMNDAFCYAMLLSSLPQHPTDLFAATRPPLSRIQLDHRLSMLKPHHAQQLALIEQLMYWRKLHNVDDAALLKNIAQQLPQVSDPFLRDLVSWRLRLRTVIAALRTRALARESYDSSRFPGFGPDVWRIRRHWQEADFGLGRTMPWVQQAKQLVDAGESYALEKLILGLIWQHYARITNGHYFDFAAVVIYVLRWDIIQRWSSYNREKALARFDALVDDAIDQANQAADSALAPLFSDQPKRSVSTTVTL